MRPIDQDQSIGTWMRDVVADWDNTRPRSTQIVLGPSQLGGCREYIRSVVENEPGLPETGFKSAAFMGTAIGDLIERVFTEQADAITQLEIVTTLPRVNVTVAGSSDIIIPPKTIELENEKVRLLVEGGCIIDVKSKDKLAEVRRYGASLENVVQISTYLIGAVQMGVLPPTASAVLLYVDRSGSDRKFVSVTMDYDEAVRWVELAEERLMDVQDVISRGSQEEDKWALRDKAPSWCFAVQCEFRENCWGGSEHRPTGKIEHPQELQAVSRYVTAQADEKDAIARKAESRRQLVGVTGITPDGTTVTWTPTGKRGGPDDEPLLRLDVRVGR